MSDQVIALAARLDAALRAPHVDTVGAFPLISDEDWQTLQGMRSVMRLAPGESEPFALLAQQWALVPATLAAWQRTAAPLPDTASDLDRAYRADYRARTLRQQRDLLEIPPTGAPLLQVAAMGLWKVAGAAALLIAAQDAEHLADSVPLGEAKDLRAAAESKRATAGEISEAIDLLGDDWREYVLDIQPPAPALQPVPAPSRIGKW